MKKLSREQLYKKAKSLYHLGMRIPLLSALVQKCHPFVLRLFIKAGYSPLPKTSASDWQYNYTQQHAADYIALEQLSNKSSQHTHTVLAFYLPQFHAFQENDDWWGKGFTEWTNVSKAIPMFIGHEQPKLPGELGYYNLTLPSVMQRQAELAKQVGIDAFCVYFYWFAGKTLMEQPLKNWLNQPELDFPLALCWANENWTRRWDGQDEDILISQQHSPEDDLAFITHIAPYLLDPRYHRVQGKPLIIIYYPSLLPNVAQTAQRWRDYMQQHHQTELYIMCVHSRDKLNPNEIGLDGAIEFPPAIGQSARYMGDLTLTQPSYQGGVYDYQKTVEQVLKKDHTQNYYLARGVMPGWDNTARRPTKGNVFIHADAATYGRWLHDAILTMRWNHAQQPQLTFINAWNEWAEGAYLEPDRRHGYANLHATSTAIYHWDQPAAILLEPGKQIHRYAIQIHAYYPDVLQHIQQKLEQTQLNADIWITLADPGAIPQIQAYWPNARIYHTPNLGRDIAPFIAVLADIHRQNYQGVLKIHTKKSPHRDDGDGWRNYLYQQLIPNAQDVAQFLNNWQQQPHIGMIVPDGHAPAIKHFWGRNANWLKRLQNKFNLPTITGEEAFSAGSMFWFRPNALQQLADAIEVGDFYHDDINTTDGTLAHAIERLFIILAQHQGYQYQQMSELLNRPTDYNKNNWSKYLGRSRRIDPESN